jgi:hypothetical protein
MVHGAWSGLIACALTMEPVVRPSTTPEDVKQNNEQLNNTKPWIEVWAPASGGSGQAVRLQVLLAVEVLPFIWLVQDLKCQFITTSLVSLFSTADVDQEHAPRISIGGNVNCLRGNSGCLR